MNTRKLCVIARVLLVCSSLTILAPGCVHIDGAGVTPRKLAVTLPPPPAFLAPVATPAVKAGDDARLAYRKTEAALDVANGRLSQSRNWYSGVRSRYSGKHKQ